MSLTNVRNRTKIANVRFRTFAFGRKHTASGENRKGKHMYIAMKECNQVIGEIEGIYHEAAVRLGLSDSELNILYVLGNYDNSCNQSALYKETGMTRSTVNSTVRKLEKEGILYLTPGKGRNTCVSLTEKGEAYQKDTVQKLIEAENRVYLGWNEEERELFLKLNRQFADALKAEVDRM